MSFDAEVLAQQLAQLGRDLVYEISVLGQYENYAVEMEGEYRRLSDEHEDEVAKAFLAAEGNVEVRKAQARLTCTESRWIAHTASLEWGRAKAKLRTQQANIQALHRRVEIGRSMLSREKALMSMGGEM